MTQCTLKMSFLDLNLCNISKWMWWSFKKQPQDGSPRIAEVEVMASEATTWFLFVSGWFIDATQQKQVSWTWGCSLRYTTWAALCLGLFQIFFLALAFSCYTHRQGILIAHFSLWLLWGDWRSHGEVWSPLCSGWAVLELQVSGVRALISSSSFVELRS